MSAAADRFIDLFRRLARQAGIEDVCKVEFSERMAKIHERNCRRYAEVDPHDLHFHFAPQVLRLPLAYQKGLIMHEIGHVLCRDMPKGGTEKDADLAAERTFGVKIKYDRQWPGKGLQYVDLR